MVSPGLYTHLDLCTDVPVLTKDHVQEIDSIAGVEARGLYGGGFKESLDYQPGLLGAHGPLVEDEDMLGEKAEE